MRLQRCKPYNLRVDVGVRVSFDSRTVYDVLRDDALPEFDTSGLASSKHLPKRIINRIPKAQHRGDLALNLGCGVDATAKSVLKRAGFQSVGVDINSPQADLLCDGHALPFQARCFSLVLSIAVLEHLQHPLIAAREVLRVLKPGGTFIGTVAFLEPFHANSYYHHSHLGVLNTLQSAGFSVNRVSPSREWGVLKAQAPMYLFPRMPRKMSAMLIAPVQMLHRLWWKIGSAITHRPEVTERNRLLYGAGAFFFIATRET